MDKLLKSLDCTNITERVVLPGQALVTTSEILTPRTESSTVAIALRRTPIEVTTKTAKIIWVWRDITISITILIVMKHYIERNRFNSIFSSWLIKKIESSKSSSAQGTTLYSLKIKYYHYQQPIFYFRILFQNHI